MKAQIRKNLQTEDGTVLRGFEPESKLKDRKYTLYAYVDTDENDELYVKFGEAKKQSIFSRYDITGHKANQHMIAVWESDKGDKIIHSQLALRSKNNRGYEPADYDVLNTCEAYKILTRKGLENILKDISEYANSAVIIEKETRKDYADIIALVKEILGYNSEAYNLDLCARCGKTGITLLLSKEYNKKENIQMFFMSSYVATVKHSYSEEIETLTNNDNCKFIDPDCYESDKEMKKDILDWCANPKHYIMYYIALTGDESTTFSRRTKVATEVAKKLNSVMYVEEADFGAHCENQIKKLANLYKKCGCKHLFCMTGTDADKCEKIFNF